MSGFDYGNKRPDGQHERHPTLDVPNAPTRPIRHSYKHVGARPQHPTRPLTPDEQTQHAGANYVCFEEYPPERAPVTGRFWTQAQLDSGCGTVTRMPTKIAETYAINPAYYGSTFCCGCGGYFPVGEHGEFTWVNEDGTPTNERVGT